MKVYQSFVTKIKFHHQLRIFKKKLMRFEKMHDKLTPREILIELVIFLQYIENFNKNIVVPSSDRYDEFRVAVIRAEGREKGYNRTKIGCSVNANSICLGDVNGLKCSKLSEWLHSGNQSQLDTLALIQARPFVLREYTFLMQEIEKIV